MILKDMPELATNIVSKNSIVFKVFLEKILELWLYYQVLGFRVMFILVPLLDHQFAEKQVSKKDLVELVSSGNVKIVLTFLVKPLAIYV